MSKKSIAAEAAPSIETSESIGTIETIETTAEAVTLPNLKAEFLAVLKRQLHPSPTNPRKEFDEESIAEMAASMRKHGVIQPLIVRRWVEKDRAGEEAFEIVCGERRFRGASRVAELERLPVIVRVLTDTEVREIQIIENLQRKDVSAYDEAVGYAALLDLKAPDGSALYTPERIAEKIGKAPGYVYNRLRIRNTPKSLLEALREGKVGTRVCELVGRIPHAEDRERCAAEVLQDLHYDRAMTGEETEQHIHENYMIRLAGAVFDPKAEDLLPKAGSCEACVFRTGNDPELASQIATNQGRQNAGRTSGIDPRVCQNPKCYRDKCEAHVALVKKSAPERVLSEADAKAVFDDWGNVRFQTKMKRVEKKPDYNDVGHYDTGKLKTWGEYAKKLAVPVVLAKNPKTGEVVQLVDTSLVKAAERATDPEKPVFAHKKGGSAEGAEKASQEAAKRAREVEAEELRIAFDRLSGNLVGQMGRDELLVILGQAIDHQGIDVMLRWMGVQAGPPPKGGTWQPARQHKIEAIVKAVQAEPERYDREAILILVLMSQFCEAVSYQGIGATRFKEFAMARGVDFKEVKAAAKEIVKQRRLEAKAKKAAKEKKKPKGEREVKEPTLQEDLAAIDARFPENLPATRVELQKAMGWSQERTLAAWDAVDGRREWEMGRGGEGEMGRGGEGESEAYRVNENGVVKDPTIVVLAREGKREVIGRFAEVKGIWYAGYEVNGKDWGNSAPCKVHPDEISFQTIGLARHWVAAFAMRLFDEAVAAGEKLPKGFLATLESNLIPPDGGGETFAAPDENLDDLVAATVRALGRTAGSVTVSWGKIREALGLADSDDGTAIAQKVERGMIALGMVKKGVLDRDAASVKAILEATPAPVVVSAEVPGSGKSKLAAAVAKKKAANHPAPAGEPSEAWKCHPDLEKLDKCFAKLVKATKTWGPESIFDPVWVKSWVPGVKTDEVAWLLLKEAVHRGVIAADQVVMREE